MAGAIGTPAWEAVAAHHRDMGGQHLRDLFVTDPSRGERLVAEAGDIYLDYSKHRVTDAVSYTHLTLPTIYSV